DELGNLSGEGDFPAVPGGRYRLRLTPRWMDDQQSPHFVSARLYRGAFSPGLLLVALFALLFPPGWLLYRSSDFERRRWEESDHPTFLQRAAAAASSASA